MSQGIITGIYTVLTGVTILIVGQILIKFLIEPFHAYREHIGVITHDLIYYANVDSTMIEYYFEQLRTQASPDDAVQTLQKQRLVAIIQREWSKIDEAKYRTRQHAGNLLKVSYAIPLYQFWAVMGMVPRRKTLLRAYQNLIGLSNSVATGDRGNRLEWIAKDLRINVLRKQFGNPPKR